MIDEGERLFGPRAREQLVTLQKRDGALAIDPLLQIIAGDREAGACQFLQRPLKRQIFDGAVSRQSGQRIESAGFEFEPVRSGESELDAVICGALGDEALRRVKRIDHIFDPAAPAGELLLKKCIEGMMARIAFVAAEIDGSVDPDRKVGIDLDEAVIIPLVPVVAGPALVGDEFQGEAFAIRQVDMADGAPPAFRDRRAHHLVEPVRRDHEAIPEGLEAIDDRAASRQQPVDPGKGRVEVGQRPKLRRHAVKTLRFLDKTQPFALEHSKPGSRGDELIDQGDATAPGKWVELVRVDLDQSLMQPFRDVGEFGDRTRIGARRFPIFGGTVISIDITFVALADLQRHGDIFAGQHVERRRLAISVSSGRRGATRKQKPNEDRSQPFHKHCLPLSRRDGRSGAVEAPRASRSAPGRS